MRRIGISQYRLYHAALGPGVLLVIILSAAPSVGLQCWQQVTATEKVESFQWFGADKTRGATCSRGEEYCVQYTANMEDGLNYTTGGCLSAVRAQESHDHISCQFDGQRRIVFLYFLGKGAPVQATLYCCKTSMCNGCNHGLLKVTNESMVRERVGTPGHITSTRQRHPHFLGQLLVPPHRQESEYRHFRRLPEYLQERTTRFAKLQETREPCLSREWLGSLPMQQYNQGIARSSRRQEQAETPADAPQCEPQYGEAQSYKANATNFCALLNNRNDCKATKNAGYGLVHGSITLDQEDFPHLQFPLDLRCEWTNSNGCIPFDCYVNGMPNDLTCWQTCPDPCFSIKKCNTFSKECTCQGFPVDLTYVAPIKTTTTTAQPTTTPVPETTTPVPFTSKLQETTPSSSTTPKPTTSTTPKPTSFPLPQTTPFDDHLQTCPCEAPAINPVPADRSCRDLETRDACKVSYNKRKEDPPPPLICNWHQAKGCIPWSCFPTPGDKSCWSVCTDKCMPIKTCSIENNLECMCHWDEAVMNDPHCEGASPPPPAHTTTSSTTPQPTTTTPVPETTTPPFCDCTSLEQRASDLEELLKLLNRQTKLPDVFQCAPAVSQATTADVVVTTEAVCDLPDMHSIAHDGFDCKFHKYGVQGEMGNMGATIPPGAWPPGDNRVPHIVVYETQDHHVKAAGDIEGMEIAGVIIEFLPSPVSFLKPVTLHMPVYDLEGEMAKGREFSVAQFDPAQDKWVLKPVSTGKEVIVNGTIAGETNSFSLYAAVSFPPQDTRCRKNLGVCVSMSVLGSIVAVAVAALALVPLCCRKADEDIVFLEDEMDILYYYFRLWCAALDDAKNGPSLGTLVVHARKDLGGERAGGGKRISGALNNTISGTLSTLSSSFTSSQTSASMGKRVEVSLPTAEQLHTASMKLDELVARMREQKLSQTSAGSSSSLSVGEDRSEGGSKKGGGFAFRADGEARQTSIRLAPMQWPSADAIDIESGGGESLAVDSRRSSMTKLQTAAKSVTITRNADGGVGIGFMQAKTDGAVFVTKVMGGGPAAINGLAKIGDNIVMIDGASVSGLSAAEITAKLIGVPFSQVILGILSRDTRPQSEAGGGGGRGTATAERSASRSGVVGNGFGLATSATLELFKEADRDGDGAVNFDDFVEAIRSHSLRLDRRQASSQQRGI